jgi:hypothetical protein
VQSPRESPPPPPPPPPPDCALLAPSFVGGGKDLHAGVGGGEDLRASACRGCRGGGGAPLATPPLALALADAD